MNRTRILAVAHSIKTAAPRLLDPGYYAGRYAVREEDREGPDVPLDKIGPGVRLDIAAWTCHSYPDLCEPHDPNTVQGLWYWRNAKDILHLTAREADQLFLGVNGKEHADLTHETATQASARLEAFALNSVKETTSATQ